MVTVDASEIEDFHAILNSNGYESSDFEIKDTDNSNTSNAVFAVSGNVEIKSLKTGAKKSYRSGNASCWPSEFESDLKGGSFS